MHCAFRNACTRNDACIAAKDGPLAFSILPVLFTEHVPPQGCWSYFGLKATPTLDDVIGHLQKLCAPRIIGGVGHSVLDDWKYHLPHLRVFHGIYAFLNDEIVETIKDKYG